MNTEFITLTHQDKNMDDKKKKLRIEKYKYKNFKNKDFIPNRCTECTTKKTGKISYKSRDDKRLTSLKKNKARLDIYPCPFGNGWHATSDKNFKERSEIKNKYKNIELALYIDDKRHLFHLNKKNYAFSQLLKYKNITNLMFVTLWDENQNNARNLQYLNILKKFLLKYNYEPYEIEIYQKNQSDITLYGYAFTNDKSKKINELLSQNNINYYFYMTNNGILKISSNFPESIA